MIVNNVKFRPGFQINVLGNIYITSSVCSDINAFSLDYVARDYIRYEDPEYEIFYEIAEYGVADSLEQIEAYYEKLKTHPKLWVIEACEVRKEEQGPGHKWRWEKWGPYIGTKKPKAEYLYDEPEITSVWCFGVKEVFPKTWETFITRGKINKIPVEVTWEARNWHTNPIGCRIVNGPEIDLKDIEAERDFGISHQQFVKEFWAIINNFTPRP